MKWLSGLDRGTTRHYAAALLMMGAVLPATAGAQSPATPLLSLAEATVEPATATADSTRTQPADSAAAEEAIETSIELHGLLQAWYSREGYAADESFLIRRAEMAADGRFGPNTQWSLRMDFAKRGQPLLDAYLSLKLRPWLGIKAGQFKVPLSGEGMISPGALPTVERALFISDGSRGGTYGNIRDIGAALTGTVAGAVDYQVGVFNGLGDSSKSTDGTVRKAAAGRLVVRPGVEGLQIGASAAIAPDSTGTFESGHRYGGELAYTWSRLGLQAEAMAGRDGQRLRQGWYAQAEYRFNPAFRGVARLDGWDPDTRTESSEVDVAELDYVAGFSYQVPGSNVKFQTNYIHKTFGQLAPSRDHFRIHLQTAW